MAKFGVDVEMRIYKTIIVDAVDDEAAYNRVSEQLHNGNIDFNPIYDVHEWEIIDTWEKQ